MNLLPTGLEILQHIHALAADLPDPATTLAAELGYTSRTVGSWIATARNWATVDEETADRVASYTIEQLAIISRAMNKSRDPEAVRTTLIDATSRGLTCDQLKIKADEAVQENQPKKPRTALTFSTRADGTGTKFAQLALPSLQMNKLQALVRKHWPTGEEAKHMTESLRNGIGFLNLLASTSVDGGDPWDITLTPAFPIALPGSKYVGDGKFITTPATFSPAPTSPTPHYPSTATSPFTTATATSAAATSSNRNASPPNNSVPPLPSTKSTVPTNNAPRWQRSAKATTYGHTRPAAKQRAATSCSPANHTTLPTTTTATSTAPRKTGGPGATSTARRGANAPTRKNSTTTPRRVLNDRGGPSSRQN
ncbi:MAG: hypothetical protein ACHEUT_05675 [Corynebacterium pyruviciproducens]|uniref:hypothetical protein n=1 Tax=Corynebacterium pyruviciproducens TaxID=598660 RepID=UPI00398396F3